MAPYGLCADEFTDTGNWPRLLYLREGRRLIGATVLVEPDVELTRTKPDTIAIASYAFDSHHVSRWIDGSNRVRVEGGFWNGRAAATRWSIPYRSLTPRADDATNLLVSVTVSASHVANASLRMEPQYMMIGEAAGTAAAIAARVSGGPIAVQAVNVGQLRTSLKAHGAVIDNYLFWDTVGSPFRGDIEATFLREVTFGCSPINFCPSAITQRQVMAAWLARALDLPPATRDWFTDDETSPYEDSINRVADAGVTAGCGAGQVLSGQRSLPRPDGGVPESCVSPPRDPPRLLHRRQHRHVRERHQRAGGIRHHRRMRRHEVLPEGRGDPGSDGGFPVARDSLT